MLDPGCQRARCSPKKGMMWRCVLPHVAAKVGFVAAVAGLGS